MIDDHQKIEDLEKLAKLKSDGVLTNEEFESAKSRLLDSDNLKQARVAQKAEEEPRQLPETLDHGVKKEYGDSLSIPSSARTAQKKRNLLVAGGIAGFISLILIFALTSKDDNQVAKSDSGTGFSILDTLSYYDSQLAKTNEAAEATTASTLAPPAPPPPPATNALNEDSLPMAGGAATTTTDLEQAILEAEHPGTNAAGEWKKLRNLVGKNENGTHLVHGWLLYVRDVFGDEGGSGSDYDVWCSLNKEFSDMGVLLRGAASNWSIHENDRLIVSGKFAGVDRFGKVIILADSVENEGAN